MSQSLDVITALVAEGLRKHMTTHRKYLAPSERQAIAADSAAVALAVLVDVTGGHDHIVRAFDDGTFTLQHPLIERLTDDLFACEILDHLAAGEPIDAGRYKVIATDSQTFELIPTKDQP
ncbi:hypothetical protein CJ226_08995 [Microbacterium sp. UMB0228]|uniref:DUF6085 family protein n=1 Tax=Microbacterium sp. UMB0228 TaxID=2029109 RepID=UPI000C804362|nr:DUF6085 family protein [Microbacterium sp. UMB0228]PMC04133.1 hypothetical protein CJ226_08995 [Microbacterium sp. UMB0228]